MSSLSRSPLASDTGPIRADEVETRTRREISRPASHRCVGSFCGRPRENHTPGRKRSRVAERSWPHRVPSFQTRAKSHDTDHQLAHFTPPRAFSDTAHAS